MDNNNKLFVNYLGYSPSIAHMYGYCQILPKKIYDTGLLTLAYAENHSYKKNPPIQAIDVQIEKKEHRKWLDGL